MPPTLFWVMSYLILFKSTVNWARWQEIPETVSDCISKIMMSAQTCNLVRRADFNQSKINKNKIRQLTFVTGQLRHWLTWVFFSSQYQSFICVANTKYYNFFIFEMQQSGRNSNSFIRQFSNPVYEHWIWHCWVFV